jgi:hypothetical protein
MGKMAACLGCDARDMDPFLKRDQGCFVEEIRLAELHDTIVAANSPVVLVAGICARGTAY